MKAFLVDRYGSKDGLRAGEVPDPVPQGDEVLVQVHAASVNPVDNKVKAGDFKLVLPHDPPFILGHDLAGTVLAVGGAVTRFRPGDEVYGVPDTDRVGTFSELIAVRERDLALKPSGLTMTEAAAIPLVALTAWQALVERAQVRPGQKVLIHAGSGGVGTVAIQLAKHLGAHVATTTSAANAEWVKALGADVVIDYKTQDFAALLHDYDVVLDSQGGKTLAGSLRVLKPGGLVIGIAGPSDPAFARQIEAGVVLKVATRVLSLTTRIKARRRGVRYSFLFMTANGAQLGEITALVDKGELRPVLDRTVPFEQTNEALAYVQGGRAKGKVVITVR